jgi:hypothetical protein
MTPPPLRGTSPASPGRNEKTCESDNRPPSRYAGANQHQPKELRVEKKPKAPPTLAEAGIDKNLAHRARTYAAVPQEQFEQLLADKRQSQNRRVVLPPDVEAEAEATRDIESERDTGRPSR